MLVGGPGAHQRTLDFKSGRPKREPEQVVDGVRDTGELSVDEVEVEQAQEHQGGGRERTPITTTLPDPRALDHARNSTIAATAERMMILTMNGVTTARASPHSRSVRVEAAKPHDPGGGEHGDERDLQRDDGEGSDRCRTVS